MSDQAIPSSFDTAAIMIREATKMSLGLSDVPALTLQTAAPSPAPVPRRPRLTLIKGGLLCLAAVPVLLGLAGLSPARAQQVCPDPYSARGACVPITGNAAGSTGAVAGTLAASSSGKLTFICGFEVDAIGGTATVGPITIAGLVGSSMVFQGSSSAAGGPVAKQNFTPCLAGSGPNTAITITTTADGTATAVNVNSWGFQQ